MTNREKALEEALERQKAENAKLQHAILHPKERINPEPKTYGMKKVAHGDEVLAELPEGDYIKREDYRALARHFLKRGAEIERLEDALGRIGNIALPGHGTETAIRDLALAALNGEPLPTWEQLAALSLPAETVEAGEDVLDSPRLMEALAALEHERWADWMSHQFKQGVFNEDGTWTMPKWAVDRWVCQAQLLYAVLTEPEKESDRREVRRYLPLIRAALHPPQSAEAAPLPAPSAWRSMEDAPKDHGHRVLLASKYGDVLYGYWDVSLPVAGWTTLDSDGQESSWKKGTFTRWMPLPPPPEVKL